MYYYPENLKARATLWLWRLGDLSVIGISAMISVLMLTQFGLFMSIVVTAAYAFLTIRIEDVAIMDFIKHAAAFFIGTPRRYDWGIELEAD